MRTDFQRVLDFYERSAASEVERAQRPGAWFEMMRALSIFESHVVEPSKVLDLGAGSGRYTVELARRGHSVTAADLSRALLDHAQGRARDEGVEEEIRAFDEVNAVDLSLYPNAAFDCVLALGPFYHLVHADERARAASEIHRVLLPGGVVIAMFIPLLSGLNGFVWRAAARAQTLDGDTLRQTYETGTYISPNGADQQILQFMRPVDVRRLFEESGFETLEVVSLRGFTRGFDHHLRDILGRDPELFDSFMHVVEQTSRDPGVLELGGHALYVGRIVSGGYDGGR